MLPWSDEFVWDAGHVAFFGAFYAVLLAVAAVVVTSLWRARSDARAGRSEQVAWLAAFQELPPRARACRHQLTGEAPGRVCERGFECRSCEAHASFEAARATQPAPRPAPSGLDLPLDRLYHRGHAFVKPEPDGTVSVGLDDLARRLAGPAAEAIELPGVGSRLVRNAPALRMRAHGSELRVLAPLDGMVVGAEGTGAAVTLRVATDGAFAPELLAGEEVDAWALREVERLQRLLSCRGVGVAMADGGQLVPDLGSALPAERRDAVLGEMLLDL